MKNDRIGLCAVSTVVRDKRNNSQNKFLFLTLKIVTVNIKNPRIMRIIWVYIFIEFNITVWDATFAFESMLPNRIAFIELNRASIK